MHAQILVGLWNEALRDSASLHPPSLSVNQLYLENKTQTGKMHRDGAFVMFLATLVSIYSPLRGAERSVSCLLRSSCLLPCPFDPGPEVVIHWLHPPDATSSVHSFYHDADQLGLQLPRYKGRTKLFSEQINKGNASLLLSGVELEDRGRYKCYTSTISGNNEDLINVEVQAPVREVSLREDGSFLNCVSSEVFPEPSVSWTPHSDHSLSVKPSESGLFSVNSSVPLTPSSPKEYICNISTVHSWRSATYRRTDGVTWSGSRTVLSCDETNETIKSLLWTFNRTQTIFKKTETDKVYSPDWESRLEQEPGSELVLTDLTKNQQGLYSCELITDLSTYLTVTEVTVEGKTGASTALIVGVIVAVIAAVVAAVFLGRFLWRHFKKKGKGAFKRTPTNDS